MDNVQKWYYAENAKRIVDTLNERKFVAQYAEDAEQAKELALNIIEKGSTIGLGGSMTLNQLGLVDHFRNGDYNLIDRYKATSYEEQVEYYRKGLLSDFFVSSVNAITRNGELVNVDCSGNRVASQIFGPKKVVIIAGANKIVDTLDDAFKRLKTVAPQNCKRLNHHTPCSVTGVCSDCAIQARMCNYTTIIHHGMKEKDRIHVIMVAENLGY